MKTLLLAFALVSTPALAVELPPTSPRPQPSYLKGGRIDVRLKSRKVYKFSADQWKVVPRPTVAVDPERIKLLYAEIQRLEKELAEAKKVQPSAPPVFVQFHDVQIPQAKTARNRVSALAGVGPAGLKAADRGADTEVKVKTGFVMGLSYSRLLSGPWSLAVSAQTNRTALVGVGYDF